MKCICGCAAFTKLDKKVYGVTSKGETILDESSKVVFVACTDCGIVRQQNAMFKNEEEYALFYRSKYEPNNPEYVAKTYEHDKNLAKLRCDSYEIYKRAAENAAASVKQSFYVYKLIKGRHRAHQKVLRPGDILELNAPIPIVFANKFELISSPQSMKKVQLPTSSIIERILDVGAGSGAFVDECRERGHDAYGCEMANYNYALSSQYIYKNRLENIYFPTDYFDKVTAHDVLEHSLNPVELLDEMFRITKQNGMCVIDLPNFFSEEGKHHWKAEHIWCFPIDGLESLALKTGFVIKDVKQPIPSKVVFYLSKPKQNRATILVPPGIGDSYWSITKMEAFIQREKIGIPDIHVACPREKEFDGHKRAFPFIEMFPFLNATRETFESNDRGSRELWNEAYARKGRTIFKNIFGYNYFISYNGHLRFGEQMEQIDPDLKTNWFPRMFVSLEQERFKNECVRKYGRYIVFYFVFQGTYINWTKEFPLESVVTLVESTMKETDCVPVFAGAVWDKKRDPSLDFVKNAIPNSVDLTGQTTVEQLFGLIKGSQMVVGYPSGLTIASAMLKAKTLIIWNDFYNSDFAQYACPPSTRNTTYFAENTKNLNPLVLASKIKALINVK